MAEQTDEELCQAAWRTGRRRECSAVMVAEIPNTNERTGHLCDGAGRPHKAHGCGCGYIWWRDEATGTVRWSNPAGASDPTRRPRFYGQTRPFEGPELDMGVPGVGPYDEAHAGNTGPGWPVDPAE